MATATASYNNRSLLRTSWDGSSGVLHTPPSTPRGNSLVAHAFSRSPSSVGKQQAADDNGHSAHGHSRLTREAAKLGLVGLLRAMAITKLYQASALRMLTTHAQAIAGGRTAPPPGPAPSPPPPDRDMTTKAAAATTVEAPPAVPTSAAPAVPSLDTSSPICASIPIVMPTTMPTNTTMPMNTSTVMPAVPPPPASSPVASRQVEAALWQDELRHLQARRAALLSEVAALTSQLQERWGAGQLAGLAGSFCSTGPEFCALTALVEAQEEVVALRASLKREIRALGKQMSALWPAAYAAAAGAATSNATAAAGPDGHSHGSTAPAASVSSHPLAADTERVVRHLQATCQSVALEVTHLLVRVAQLKQLPAQPKKRTTVAYVREQVVAELYARQAHLQQYTEAMQMMQQQA